MPWPFVALMASPMKKPALLLADLVVARAVLVDVARVLGQHGVDHRAELAFVADLCEAALFDDLLRALGLGEALGEHVLGLVARQRAVGDEIDELREPVGRERQHRRRRARSR